jgi:indolepyruvate decarboxylase
MPTVSDFLIERIQDAGIKHLFGVTGEFIADFLGRASKSSKISVVTTVSEDGAAIAADAYARVNGAGCVCVTYNVGALKIVNAVACAFAERSPVIIVSGAPSAKEREVGGLASHMVRSYGCQKSIFESITCAQAVLDSPANAGFEIDRVLEAMKHYRQPVYIELPAHVAEKNIAYDVYRQGTPQSPKSNVQTLEDALEETVNWINSSSRPVILAGVEVARFGLGQKVMKFAERSNIPVVSTMLSKSVVPERHPLYLGTYSAGSSQPGVTEAMEQSDCIIMLGVMMGDASLTTIPKKQPQKRNVISATVEELVVKNHSYKDVQFVDFAEALCKAEVQKKSTGFVSRIIGRQEFTAEQKKITMARLFDKINTVLGENTVLADIGNSLHGAVDLTINQSSGFIASALYGTMGRSIPASIGVGMARPCQRPFVITGDGSFQMSVAEIGTLLKNGINPIIFVLNNGGYCTQRMKQGGEFNTIPAWNYHRIIDTFGGGTGVRVQTEDELDRAVNQAMSSTELTVINVILDPEDVVPALKRLQAGRNV